MGQPRLSHRTRALVNAGLTGALGSKKALAARTDVDEATVTRAFQPHSAAVTSLEPSAEVVLEALALLCELGRPDVVEEDLRRRGARVRVVADDDLGVDRAAAGDVAHVALGSASQHAGVLNAVRLAIADGRVTPAEVREIHQASRALSAVLARLERTAEAAAEGE